MNRLVAACLLPVVLAAPALAGEPLTKQAANTDGISAAIKSSSSRLFWFDLTNFGADMLHGYVPKDGDVVEWYVREVNCIEPEKSCSFELAIRKRVK
jgi:hypothetical protein